MSAQPVDVLAVLDRAADLLESKSRTDERRLDALLREAVAARAAVAELIGADRMYDDACANLEFAQQHDPKHVTERGFSVAVAKDRRAAALARCGGTA